MKHITPKTGVGGQEIAHLGSAIIKNGCAPVRVLPFERVWIFVQRRAIKTRQGPVVFGKMGRHPIDDHADAGIVQCINQDLKFLRRSITT